MAAQPAALQDAGALSEPDYVSKLVSHFKLYWQYQLEYSDRIWLSLHCLTIGFKLRRRLNLNEYVKMLKTFNAR